MSAIDTQNAKQIRDPMDVLIRMELRDDIPMTYSGYTSTAKVADGLLNDSYPMRVLADLQGDGFALNGDAVLYDSSVTPSDVNGKIGIRGNVGQDVDVTVSSTSTIKTLSLFVTGATSVTYNGTTAVIVGNQAVVPVNANSISLSFAYADANRRIEIDLATPGLTFSVNNDSLISAVVSLRSDLSIFGQTLPESELNVEVYNDADISEAVASIPDDVPITYQAGYPGDMSPARKFYVSGKVTWKDNVLSIHAVDAVHFLDRDLPSSLNIEYPYKLYDLMRHMLESSGISASYDEDDGGTHQLYGHVAVQRQSMRDAMALITWIMHGKFWTGAGDPYDYSYVDAGIPSLRNGKRYSPYEIYEEDAGDYTKNINRAITKINLNMPNYDKDGYTAYGKVGSYDWYKNKGAFLSIDEGCHNFSVAMTNEEFSSGSSPGWWSSAGAIGIIPATSNGLSSAWYSHISSGIYCLLDSSVLQGDALIGNSGDYAYTQVVPWDSPYAQGQFFNITSQSQMWDFLTSIGVFEDSLENYSGVLWGYKMQQIPTTRTIGSGTASIDLDVSNIWGSFRDNYGSGQEQFPEFVFEEMLNKSNETGSFRHKGDPRWQPRDVVAFHRLDGTTETITLENITITHEGGGTWADVTYRKGEN